MLGKKISKRTAIIATSAAAALILTGGGAYAMLSPKNPYPVLPAADTAVVATRDIEEKVQTNGQIHPTKKTAITAGINSPVTKLQVEVGDRIQAEQVVAELDTTALQRSIELENASKSAAKTTSAGELTAAQQLYQQKREQFDQGLNPEINSAVAAQQQAQGALDSAKRQFSHKQEQRAEAMSPAIVEKQHALTAARDEQRDAALGLVRASAGSLYGIYQTGEGSPEQLVDVVSAEERARRADRNLAETQQTFQRTLSEVDLELAEANAQLSEAHRRYSEAAVAVESARLSALHGIDAQRTAVEQAETAANTAGLTNEVTARHAQADLEKATLRSPHAGVVTEIGAVEGAPSEGPVMLVADDSKLIVRALVKEADIARIKAGDSVRFSTPATKDKKFTGTVVKVAPAANGHTLPAGGPAAAAGGGASASGVGDGKEKVEYPVDIAVTGDREGLRLGASTKADIVVNSKPHALVVPREAVFATDSGHEVTVVRKDGDAYVVEKLPVSVLAQTDFEAAIDGAGVDEGVRVITDPRKYADKVGQKVSLQEQGK
ncbi:efflux RND transporter periplasmic adaptor subunit [Staphylococcus chromogenes]|nr:efflux RND transporter periplasmic adaptor subunit [Staphylococcus chromogenes]